ncbi:antitoxin [Nocardioides humilatus]|uniref:Antitoxin n=1 Tax=Nocardioides humilatus TaxID=2607660 RepID=A0A5B1LQG5_9ACTN|nr:antitoxin [Nocardioides humilatus]KAA1421929.1 antitoxin [Nocardioides humilatus]
MKISASLPDEDVEFLDRYAADHGESRSGALHRAVALLRHRDLGDQYEAAWASDNADDWHGTLRDGLAAE